MNNRVELNDAMLDGVIGGLKMKYDASQGLSGTIGLTDSSEYIFDNYNDVINYVTANKTLPQAEILAGMVSAGIIHK